MKKLEVTISLNCPLKKDSIHDTSSFVWKADYVQYGSVLDPDPDPKISIKNKQFVFMINNNNNMVYHVLSVSDNSPSPSPPLSPPPSPPPPSPHPSFLKWFSIFYSLLCVCYHVPRAARPIFAEFLPDFCNSCVSTQTIGTCGCVQKLYTPPLIMHPPSPLS